MVVQSQYYINAPEYVGDLSSVTLYDAYVHANRDNWDSLAIISMNGELRYTHGELKNMIDLAAGGFWKLGFRQGARVGIILNNTVEEAVSLLALNKVGAVAVFVDATKAISDIAHAIDGYELDLIIFDETMIALEPFINTKHVPIVLVNQTKPAPNAMSFLDLYRLGAGVEVIPAPFEKGRPSVFINSSGTTGLPKPIVHTDHSINMAAYKILRTNYPLTRDNLTMKVVPSFIGLGLITTLYTALLSGTKIVLLSGKNPPACIENTVAFSSGFPRFRDEIGLGKDAKLILFAAPMFFRVMCEKLDLFEDMSYWGAMLAAGSKMGKQELDHLNSKLSARSCPVKICNGYGQNELCGAVTLNSNSAYKPGSAGFPVIGTTIRIVDPETHEEQMVHETGLILERSDSFFEYYHNLPHETQSAFLELDDGAKWFNTKDLGFLDEDGFLFVTGRISRVLVCYDMKLPIDKIEDKIKQHPAVTECAVVPIPNEASGEVPVAFIMVAPEMEQIEPKTILEDIQSGCNPLANLEIPAQIIKCRDLPLLESGKIDYRALQKQFLK